MASSTLKMCAVSFAGQKSIESGSNREGAPQEERESRAQNDHCCRMRRRMNHADDGGGVWNKTNSAQPGEPLLFRGSLNYNKLETTLLEM
jgi:hypothetical protein